MEKFILSAAFKIGHKKIDSDHVKLVAILNDMVDGFVNNDKNICQEKWGIFCEALELHFKEESVIMADIGFVPDDHEVEHDNALNHIKQLGREIISLEDWEGCLYEMRNKLLSLILKEDLIFAEYLVTIAYKDGLKETLYPYK